jgi:hypothetical protein
MIKRYILTTLMVLLVTVTSCGPKGSEETGGLWDEYPTLTVYNNGAMSAHIYVDNMKMGIASGGMRPDCIILRVPRGQGPIRLTVRRLKTVVSTTMDFYASHTGGWVLELSINDNSLKYDIESIMPAPKCEK